jgi:hypothetical protein
MWIPLDTRYFKTPQHHAELSTSIYYSLVRKTVSSCLHFYFFLFLRWEASDEFILSVFFLRQQIDSSLSLWLLKWNLTATPLDFFLLFKLRIYENISTDEVYQFSAANPRQLFNYLYMVEIKLLFLPIDPKNNYLHLFLSELPRNKNPSFFHVLKVA